MGKTISFSGLITRCGLVLWAASLSLWGQARFEVEPDKDYVLKVPVGYDRWPLMPTSGDAAWCYDSREKRDDIGSSALG